MIDNPKLPDTLNGFTAAVAAFGCKCIHALFRLFHVTPKKTYGKYLKYATNCPEPDSDLYIDYSYITGQNLMIRTKEAFPTIEVPFEDTTVALVRNYDSFLRPEYGDYMQLPPENQRHNHMATFIDFGEN